jgi:alpha-glucosidase
MGLRVILDIVPNHTSDEHEWFRSALAAGPGSPERSRYIFRPGRGDGPPNDWRSVFGGPAWQQVPDGEWYLHLFDVKQPDLNWDNPEIGDEFESILRFWLDRGIDGFRVDVAHGLVKQKGLPDYDVELHILDGEVKPGAPMPPMWDQDGVHDVYRRWHKVLAEYGEPDRILVAEAWVRPQERAVRYIRPDEMHQTFNFDFLMSQWRAADLREVIESSLAAADSVGAPSTWVLSNHDVVRHASRLGLPVGQRRPNGIGAEDPQPDRALGLQRARAATQLMLALPGGAYLYQGEELGLPDSTDMPDESRQDPTFLRSGGKELGRDGCRVPMPWQKDAPSFGFGPSDQTWLPQPGFYGEYTVDQQDGVDGSTLELYRTLLRTRRERDLGTGGLRFADGFGADVIALVNTGQGGDTGETLVVANLGTDPVALPDGATVVVASGPLTADGLVPTDTTVWAAL